RGAEPVQRRPHLVLVPVAAGVAHAQRSAAVVVVAVVVVVLGELPYRPCLPLGQYVMAAVDGGLAVGRQAVGVPLRGMVAGGRVGTGDDPVRVVLRLEALVRVGDGVGIRVQVEHFLEGEWRIANAFDSQPRRIRRLARAGCASMSTTSTPGRRRTRRLTG